MMIRTQISLTKEEYQTARQEARRLGISLAELLRRSLRTMLPVDGDKPWMRYAGLIESGDSQASQHIDEIVYGHKP
ncbi:CopG family transcriptional regulator [Candidatus Nitrospira salsa]